MASWTGKKNNVVFSKPNEPSFLKKFKEKVGYKEESGVSEKFEKLPKATEDDLADGDDELPQVVQLNPGDISEEEYKKMITKEKADNEEIQEKCDIDSGKILFKKPCGKRSHESELKSSTKKSKSSMTDNEVEKIKQKSKDKKNEKSNRSLLSFEEDEDEV